VIFPSYIFFLVFLPLTLSAWYLLRGHTRARLFALTLASYWFYGSWDYRFTLLLLASTVLDYVVGARIAATGDPKLRWRWLMVSLVGDLGALAFFKYYDFFVGSAQTSLAWLGIEADLPLLHLVLPLGISFYTFQSLSYTIDIYRGQCRPAKDFLHFAAYVSMFPQLVAGPIVRYADVEDQLRVSPSRSATPDRIVEGVWLFAIGVAKKIWVADTIAPLAEACFDGSGTPSVLVAWTGVLAYTFQLYFDFSGYTDMARGLGKMIGFDFPINFDSPYKSVDISDFWNRWHITLSRFIRDYIFIPLGGSWGTRAETVKNLIITMGLGGLWHGAGWTFVVWGLYHGVLLATNAVWSGAGRALPAGLGRVLTFVAVVLGWVIFRAPTMDRAGDVLVGLAGGGGAMDALTRTRWLEAHGVALPVLAAAAAIAFFAPNSQELPKPARPVFGFVLAIALLATMTTFMKETPFLYFQF